MTSGVYVRGLSIEDRFWNQVRKTNDCWEWTGALDKDGYGIITICGKAKRVHRISWEWNTKIPLGNKCVLHKCDNTKCVNPDHLWAGSQHENMLDMTNKGRRGTWHPVGKLNPNYKHGKRVK